MKTFFGITILACMMSCHFDPWHNTTKLRAVVIQPFTGTDSKTVDYIFRELKKMYPDVALKDPVKLPGFAYYPPGNRYRANLLMRYLKTIDSNNNFILGITNRDISTTKDSVYDWGVMGLGEEPGTVSVVSTFRLSKTEINGQLLKVVLHELGHNEGLPHCTVKTCLMKDAEGHNLTDEEKGFCPKCKAYMQKRGWHF